MGDVNLEIDLDQQGLRQGIRRTERTLEQMERRLSRRRARARLRRIRADRQAEARITREREREERNRLRMEARLSRRRARARLRQMRERRRQEARIEREAERERERRRERRRRIARGAVGIGGRAAGGAGFAVGGAALGTLGALFDSEQVLEFGRALAVLAGSADISRKKQAELAESLTNVSLQTGKARTGILAGFEAVIEKSGDFDLAEQTILAMSKASVGLNADMVDLGRLAAALGTTFGKSSKEVIRFFEVLAAQGDKGKVTLKDIAGIAEDIFVTAAGVGLKGESSVVSIGALLQSGIGSADERKTAVTNFLKALTDPKKIEKAFPGVKVKTAEGEFRDPVRILKDVIRQTKGETANIGKGFTGAESLFFEAARDFRDTGKFGTLDKFLGLGAGSKGLIEKRFTRVEETASVVALEKLQGLMTMLSDVALAPALGAFSKSLEELLKQDLTVLTEGFSALGSILGFLTKAVVGSVSALGKIKGFFGGSSDSTTKPIPFKAPSQAPVKEKQEQQGAGKIDLTVNNSVTVDDRGNPKKSRTRVDAQNNSNVGRTIGVSSNE